MHKTVLKGLQMGLKHVLNGVIGAKMVLLVPWGPWEHYGSLMVPNCT